MISQTNIKLTKQVNTKMLIRTAIMVSLLFVTTQILIPIPTTPIPINLALITVLLSGCILGPLWGTTSIVVYILLGLIGLPIYSNFGSGIGHLLGATGGFLFAYIPAALIASLGSNQIRNNKNITPIDIILLVLILILSLIVTYAIGTIFFVYITNTSISTALSLTVFPFLLGDLFKLALTSLLAFRLKSIL
ncbi:MAG: biotin transporter BioY [Firmicutes bacterium]|nr:biotin transporter BioY [Bacillota bacterium]MCL1953504.1 biotin transporter BioY [Bacillota bacterium]